MQISHRHRFVFLSYARTGSRTACRLLEPYCDVPILKKREVTAEKPYFKHMTWRAVEAQFAAEGRSLADYRTAVFCRNPFDRVRSLYRHHVVAQAPGTAVSWPEFVAQFRAVKPRGNYGRLRMPLVEFAGDGESARVGKVLRYEDYEASLEALLGHFALPSDTEVTRRDDAKKLETIGGDHRSLAYDRAMARTLIRAYRADFERFGYDLKSWQA